MTVSFRVEDFDADVLAMLDRVELALSPAHMAEPFLLGLRKLFQDQIREAFAEQGAPDGKKWAHLSDWRMDDRMREGGDEGPILKHTGKLFIEALGFRGKVRMVSDGFSYWYPDYHEMSGKYIGITGGQLVNPLGATPLAKTPRPMLGGAARMLQDTVEAFATYLESEGFIVEIGGSSDA